MTELIVLWNTVITECCFLTLQGFQTLVFYSDGFMDI